MSRHPTSPRALAAATTAALATALCAPARALAQTAAPAAADAEVPPRPPRPVPPPAPPPAPRPFAPRVMFSVGHVIGWGIHATTPGGGLLGGELMVGVQLTPLVSVQLQGAYTRGFTSHIARAGAIVGFASSREVSVGFGLSALEVSQANGLMGVGLGLPLDVTVSFTGARSPAERVYAPLVGFRVDPTVGVSSEAPPIGVGSVGFSAMVSVGFVSR